MLLLILNLFCTVTISIDSYQCGQNNDIFESKVISKLKNDGYIIEEGILRWYSNTSAYGANPSLFYGIFDFNRSHNIIPDTKVTNVANNINNLKDLKNIRPHLKWEEFWFMYGSHATIWYGCHAPSQYYSYKSYQNRRYNPKYPKEYINDTQNNNQLYPMSDPYASLGDMLNNQNINSTRDGLQVIISTPDNYTYQDINAAILPYLNDLNLTNKNEVNLDMMPFENIKINGPGFGINPKFESIYYLKYPPENGNSNNLTDAALKQILNGQTLDSFGIMLRFGLPLNSTLLNQYINTKQKIYKIYYPYNKTTNKDNWDKPRQSFANKSFITNISTGIYEQDQLQPYFTNYVNGIYKYFNIDNLDLYSWRYIGTKMSLSLYNTNHKYGFNCIKYSTRCMADNRDSQYFVNWPDVSILSNTSIFLMIGIIHQDTNKCQWENIVPYFQNSGYHDKYYRSHYLAYFPSKYRYSSLEFPPNLQNNSDIPSNILSKFFIVAAMRTSMCQQYFDNNHQFPELKNIPKFCFDDNDFNYSLPTQNWFLMHRCYINPITKTRSDPNEMLSFVIMEFDTQWFDFGAP